MEPLEEEDRQQTEVLLNFFQAAGFKHPADAYFSGMTIGLLLGTQHALDADRLAESLIRYFAAYATPNEPPLPLTLHMARTRANWQSLVDEVYRQLEVSGGGKIPWPFPDLSPDAPG